MNDIDIAWLAGILEGEGCFGSNSGRYPSIWLGMTDADVVEKVAAFLGTTIHKKIRGGNRKDVYQIALGGAAAAKVMRRVLPYMGRRRTQRINDVLFKYETRTFLGRGGKDAWNKNMAGNLKITKDQKDSICAKWKQNPIYGAQSALAREFSVSSQRIGQIVRALGA